LTGTVGTGRRKEESKTKGPESRLRDEGQDVDLKDRYLDQQKRDLREWVGGGSVRKHRNCRDPSS
jgi:hypothetical protein